ncbi:uncharacterized protein LOC106078595 isoform X1 [Biomphalaria glabrata]|uniref:Uncharacterized protein LOC106078595 isoform X1 n=2 Tax=Biomphalaria glabrata TaxID=6526 RepID=A0A9W2Z3R8_BIOGL|nr:uncharacterized protein LOC106078595 isoform X1 [Biomphalaria glabrata]XP_055869583.1 uncharacterized protein LOC106078595 isoform X1 [Biomphalaria glabrata]
MKTVLLTFVLTMAFKAAVTIDKRCDVPADVVFIMDSSDSIKAEEWEQEKKFVSVLIDSLHVDRHAIHVGVIVYSTDIGLVIDLQPFKTKAELKRMLEEAAHMELGTNTAKAIETLIKMSSDQGRYVFDAKQIGVIITDGRSSDVQQTISQAQRARNEFNIDMIALGVGNETFLEELEAIAGSENRLFQVQNFSGLHNVVKQLEDLICEIIPTTTSTIETSPTTTTTMEPTTSPYVSPFPCSKPADIVFLIDGSYSVSPADWIKGKQFISYLINSIDIGMESVHVGLVVFGTDIGDIVPLSPFKNKAELKASASALVQPPIAKTNTALGIETVNSMLASQGRPDVPHILIVITDGKSSNPSETKRQAHLAKQKGIVIFVVGVGNQVVQEEMLDMATSAQSMFDAPDYKYLIGMVKVLRDNICIVIQENTTLSTSLSTTTTRVTTQPTIPALCQQCLVEGGVGFNPLPDDCEKYVLCLPNGASYTPSIKSCPFGMFWSHEAVSCLDARYVHCPADKCKNSPNLKRYPTTSDTANCRSYLSCVTGRSSPLCCEAGYRYRDGPGCIPDPSCQDPCPLDVTIYNQGACQFRPDHQSYYSYLEILPGQGNIRRNCKPGQMYSHKHCACTYDVSLVVPQIGCLPAVKLTFNGTFDDSSKNHQHIEVKGVGLSTVGSAVFTNNSLISLPNTANKEFGDKLLIRLKYRVIRNVQPGQTFTSNNWGFQGWLNKENNTHNSTEILNSELLRNISDKIHISGSESKALEKMTFIKNGSIVRDPSYVFTTNDTWSNMQLSGNIVQLGKLGNMNSSVMENGVLYISNGKGKLLIQEAHKGLKNSILSRWTVVSVNVDGSTGMIEETGLGSVPAAIQEKFGFVLMPPVLHRWAFLNPDGFVLQQGEGVIPPEVISRYEGFIDGRLIRFNDQGGVILQWNISKPDGSELQHGTGSFPSNLIDTFKLSSLLSPKQTSAVWSILSASGDVLDSGKGETIPADKVQLYAGNPLVTLFQSTSRDGHSPIWHLSRPDGVKLIQGQGSVPQGIAQFIKGEIMLPQMSSINGWKVELPNGDVQSGTGSIPQHILDIIMKHYTESNSMLPDQLVQTSGHQSLGDTQNSFLSQGSNLKQQWEITLPNGSVQHGSGPLSSDILTLLAQQNLDPTRFQGNIRTRRAAKTLEVMDVLSNCASSIQLLTSDNDIMLTVKTSKYTNGVNVTLPIHDGMNDVWLKYDGQHLTGIVNGFVMKKPLSGTILSSPHPLTIGHCPGREGNQFIGEIDLLEIHHCLP